MKVQVVYALLQEQRVVDLDVAEDCTLEQAIELSGLRQEFPGLEAGKGRVGVWGKVRPLETPLKEGDRVEVYRPRLADPKAARRERVSQPKGGKG